MNPHKYPDRSLQQLANGKRPFRSACLTLKNGLVIRDSEGREAAEILCDIDQAKGLCELASQICPDAALDIEEAFDSCARRKIAFH